MSVIAASPRAERGAEENIAILITTFIAGLAGAGLMYWTWRVDFGVPLRLTVGLHMDPTTSPVKPWAPWWVPVTIMMVMAMLLWRGLVVRASGISMIRGTLVLFLVCYLTYPAGVFCLEYGAMMQYVPRPGVTKLLAVSPLVLIEAGQTLLLYSIMGFPIAWIANVLICAASAGLARLVWRFTV